jgi:hypothetical protein
VVAHRIYRALGDGVTPREKPLAGLIHPLVALLGWWMFTGEVAHWSLAGTNLTDHLVSLPLAWTAYGLTAHALGRRHRLYWLRCIALASLGLAAVSSVIVQASQVPAPTSAGGRC